MSILFASIMALVLVLCLLHLDFEWINMYLALSFLSRKLNKLDVGMEYCVEKYSTFPVSYLVI